MDLILSLPEVKQANAYVVKHTHGKRHLFNYIHVRPDKKDCDYWVKVCEDNGGTYATHFNFFVNGKTFAIKYMDVMTSEEVPLEEIGRDKSGIKFWSIINGRSYATAKLRSVKNLSFQLNCTICYLKLRAFKQNACVNLGDIANSF